MVAWFLYIIKSVNCIKLLSSIIYIIMSRAYKIHNPEGLYYITFATVAWVDVFTRIVYREIFTESVRFCQKEKGLLLYAWCLMTNHVHTLYFVAHMKINLWNGLRQRY